MARIGWLSAAERLPDTEPEPPEAGRKIGGLVRWSLSPDALPELPPEDTRRGSIRSLARWLLAPEQLPVAEDETVKNGPGVVRWVLTSEPLPPPPDDTTASKHQEA